MVAVLDTPSEAYMSGSGAGFSPAAGMIDRVSSLGVASDCWRGRGLGDATRDARLTEGARVMRVGEGAGRWTTRCSRGTWNAMRRRCSPARGVKCRAVFVGPRRSSADESPGAETAASVTPAGARRAVGNPRSIPVPRLFLFLPAKVDSRSVGNERTRGGQSAPRARVANAHGPPRP